MACPTADALISKSFPEHLFVKKQKKKITDSDQRLTLLGTVAQTPDHFTYHLVTTLCSYNITMENKVQFRPY